tara:strand:- start:61 stop:1386 length:1326 start_codon:yes stop_codon:yes gene_type:complete
MATIDLGKVAFTHKGTYNNSTTYEDKDVVQFTDGDITSTFVYINSTSASGQQPSTGGTVNTSHWSLMAKGQPQTFNANSLKNDVATLALRQATNENKTKYNTNSMYVDVFQDATGIASGTQYRRSAEEFVVAGSQTVTNNFEINDTNYATYFGTQANSSATQGFEIQRASGTPNLDNGGTNQLPSSLAAVNHNGMAGGSYSDVMERSFQNGYFGGGTPAVQFHSGYGYWWCYKFLPAYDSAFVCKEVSIEWANGASGVDDGECFGATDSGTISRLNASRFFAGAPTNGQVYTLTNNSQSTSFPVLGIWFRYPNSNNSGGFEQLKFRGDMTIDTVTATGHFITSAVTAPSTISKMGAVITYDDHSGTNALNTDLVCQLSADGGSNYATATLTPLPNFSSTTKMAVVNDLAVTGGTSLSAKISFANQSDGVKIARVRGVSLMY